MAAFGYPLRYPGYMQVRVPESYKNQPNFVAFIDRALNEGNSLMARQGGLVDKVQPLLDRLIQVQ